MPAPSVPFCYDSICARCSDCETPTLRWFGQTPPIPDQRCQRGENRRGRCEERVRLFPIRNAACARATEVCQRQSSSYIITPRDELLVRAASLDHRDTHSALELLSSF